MLHRACLANFILFAYLAVLGLAVVSNYRCVLGSAKKCRTLSLEIETVFAIEPLR